MAIIRFSFSLLGIYLFILYVVHVEHTTTTTTTTTATTTTHTLAVPDNRSHLKESPGSCAMATRQLEGGQTILPR